MDRPIVSVEVTYLIHATEDEGKVEAALTKLFGMPLVASKDSLLGHFGNPITMGRVHLTGDEAASAFGSLVSALPRGVRREVALDIGSHIDEHMALYLRLDKQRLVSGSVALGEDDAVRIRVKPRMHVLRGGAREFYLSQLEGP